VDNALLPWNIEPKHRGLELGQGKEHKLPNGALESLAHLEQAPSLSGRTIAIASCAPGEKAGWRRSRASYGGYRRCENPGQRPNEYRYLGAARIDSLEQFLSSRVADQTRASVCGWRLSIARTVRVSERSPFSMTTRQISATPTPSASTFASTFSSTGRTRSSKRAVSSEYFS
jgi:hypothetical protein